MCKKDRLGTQQSSSIPTNPPLEYKSLTWLLYIILTAKGWSKIQGNVFPPMIFGDLLGFCCQLRRKRIMKVFKFYFSFSYRAWADSWICTET